MFLKLLFTRIKKKNKLTRTNRSNRSQRSLALPCPPNGPRKGRLSCLILDRFSNSNDMKETTVICSIRAQFQFDPFSFSSLPFPASARARTYVLSWIWTTPSPSLRVNRQPSVQYVRNVSTRRDPPGVHSQRNELRTRNTRNCGDSRVERKRERWRGQYGGNERGSMKDTHPCACDGLHRVDEKQGGREISDISADKKVSRLSL